MEAYGSDLAIPLAASHIELGWCDINSITRWCYHNERAVWEVYMEQYVIRFNSQAPADFLAQPH